MGFYQQYFSSEQADMDYEVVLRNISVCVLDFENVSFIVLIPKVKNSKKVIEYRPISLSNMIFKLISKTITN